MHSPPKTKKCPFGRAGGEPVKELSFDNPSKTRYNRGSMHFIGLLKESLSALKTHRRRTLLTSAGIIIGVAAVIVVMSVGAGAQSLIFNQITSAGSNLIGVLPGHSDEDAPPASV